MPRKRRMPANGGGEDSVDQPEKKSRKTASKKKVEREDEEVKTFISSGDLAPVDPFCTTKVGKAHIYVEDEVVWDAMLNQTNIQFNNNKFYLIQLLEDTGKNCYSIWFRWGRVGKSGQNKLMPFGHDLEAAKSTFEQKFLDKTKNEWKDKDSFVKVSGKYDMLQMDFKPTKLEAEKVQENETKVEKIKIPDSKLDEKLQKFMKLICDIQAMEETVLEMKYDSKKSPLGKLTTEQIKAGYSALKEIEELLNNGSTKQKEFVEASNRFYTRIPHNFGMKVPPIINTETQIIEKMNLLQVLSDIEVAMKILNDKKDSFENPIDRHYKGLNCQLTAMEKDDDMYEIIENYMKGTHAKTHNMYKMKVLEIFSCSREDESCQTINLGNRLLLWHGTRLTNVAGILKQGLRIAPPEAPSTGYMFGKGVYFADRSSKSANYCCTSKLHDVALGKSRELVHADYDADKLPKGFHSVKGLGEQIPDTSNYKILPDGIAIPMGKSVSSKNAKKFDLIYNEYVVYDVSQIKLKYVVMTRFKFK